MEKNKIFSKFSFIIITLLIITSINTAYGFQAKGEITVVVSKDEKVETSTNNSKREMNRDQIEKVKENVKNEAKDIKEISKEKIQNLINEATKTKTDFINETKLIREEAKNKIEEIKNKFKENLNIIKDENKKKSTENIINSINNLNIRSTDQLTDKLNQIDNVLISIESRIQKAEDGGLDASKVKELVLKAKESISSSKKIVLSQSEKIYTITIVDEASLKTKVKEVRDQFKTDIKTVREAVVSTHESVKNVATKLAQIKGINSVDEVDEETTINTTTTQ